MWNPLRWIGRDLRDCGFYGARYFETTGTDGEPRIFMRWRNGCKWLRVRDEHVPPHSEYGWTWIPADLPFRRREISMEEANRPLADMPPPSPEVIAEIRKRGPQWDEDILNGTVQLALKSDRRYR